MATNVKVTIGRNVPIVDDTGLTLAILTHNKIKDAEKSKQVNRVNSINELYELIDKPTSQLEEGKDVSVEEAYVLEYLLNNNVNLLIVDSKTISQIEEDLVDQSNLGYVFITTLNSYLVKGVEGTAIGSAVRIITDNNVNAELILNLELNANADALGGSDLIDSSKITVQQNAGIPIMNTKLELEGNEYCVPMAVQTIINKVNLLKAGTPWLPVAGQTTGLANGFSRLVKQVGRIEKENYQRNRINPTIMKRGVGNVIVSESTRHKPLSNKDPLANGYVITLNTQIRDFLFKEGEKAQFKTNSETTWQLINMSITTFLNRIKDAGGIDEFDVQVGLDRTMTREDVRNGILRINVTYLPVAVIKEIEISVVIKEDAGIYTIEMDGGL